MPCPHCGQSPTSDPLNISCGCGVLWFDTPEPNGEPEPKSEPSADMLTLLSLMASGASQQDAERHFGSELRVSHMLAFLGHRDRRYVSGWRITERGRELVLFREVA